jgi:hypothetical protein
MKHVYSYCGVTLWVRGTGASKAPHSPSSGCEGFVGGSAKKKTQYSKKHPSQWNVFHQKCHRDRPENEPRYKRWQAGGQPLKTWHDRKLCVTEKCLTKMCLTSYTMTERADQLHHHIAPTHSTALVQALLAKHHITQPRFGSLRLLTLPKAKIAVEREEICECDSHTLHKLT